MASCNEVVSSLVQLPYTKMTPAVVARLQQMWALYEIHWQLHDGADMGPTGEWQGGTAGSSSVFSISSVLALSWPVQKTFLGRVVLVAMIDWP